MTEVIEVFEERENSVYGVDVDDLEGEASNFVDGAGCGSIMMIFFSRHSVSLGELSTSREETLSFKG